jgi:predicted aminopeptidase
MFSRIVTLAVAAVLSSSCYVTRQAYFQNNLINGRRPVDEVMRDSAIDADTKTKLAEVKAILAYAREKGLRVEGAYRYFVPMDRNVVSYLVFASAAEKLELKTWWFPIVGRVPYLGYFAKAERDKVAESLRSEGLDVYESGSGAFSSLGWFEDPIYSSMLTKERADLAHLFFHELTHRTYWSPGSVEFNENLAEYVGELLTESYLRAKASPADVSKYLEQRTDRTKFRVWLQGLKAAVSQALEKGGAEVLAAKAAVYELFTKGERREQFSSFDFIGTKPWNNARLMANTLYAPDLERFRRAHACVGSVEASDLLNALKRVEDTSDDQFANLDGLCAK